ncbi:MAG: hypothetical protein J5851_03630, partial [Oscillospiraceae bacterium]|nr:hypothetical protein [Oscillospiraceae bacterium]
AFGVSTSLPFDPDSVENYRIEEPCEDETSVFNTAYDDLKKAVSQQCKGQVQGTRFTGFSVDDLHETHTTEVILLPVYRLTYRYNEKEYTVFFSGASRNETFFEERPIIQGYNQFVAENKNKCGRLNSDIIGNTVLMVLLAAGIAFILLPLFILFSVQFISDLGKHISHIPEIIRLLVVLAVSVGAVYGFIFLLNRNKKINAEKTIIENQMKEYTQDIAQKRNEIAAVIQNTSLSYEEKKEQVNQILSQ